MHYNTATNTCDHIMRCVLIENQKIVFHCSLTSFSLSASAGLSIMMSIKCAFISVLPDVEITFKNALTRAPSSLEDFCCWIIGEMDLLPVGGFLSMLNAFVPCE